MQTIIPYLSAVDAEAAIRFYAEVFGAVEKGPRLTGPDGKIAHTELTIGDCDLMLAEENPEWGNLSPATIGGASVRLVIAVDNCDATYEVALQKGAKSLIPPGDQFYGYRAARIEDPFGHAWLLSHATSEMSNDEIQAAWQAMLDQMG